MVPVLKKLIMKRSIRISMVSAALMAAFAADTTITNAKISDGQIKTHTDTASHFYFGRREVVVDNNGIHFVKAYTNKFDDDYDDNYRKYGLSWVNLHDDTHVDAFDFGVSGYG